MVLAICIRAAWNRVYKWKIHVLAVLTEKSLRRFHEMWSYLPWISIRRYEMWILSELDVLVVEKSHLQLRVGLRNLQGAIDGWVETKRDV
jgi:hypothetical protein